LTYCINGLSTKDNFFPPYLLDGNRGEIIDGRTAELQLFYHSTSSTIYHDDSVTSRVINHSKRRKVNPAVRKIEEMEKNKREKKLQSKRKESIVRVEVKVIKMNI
jgi:hypothetical protein